MDSILPAPRSPAGVARHTGHRLCKCPAPPLRRRTLRLPLQELCPDVAGGYVPPAHRDCCSARRNPGALCVQITRLPTQARRSTPERMWAVAQATIRGPVINLPQCSKAQEQVRRGRAGWMMQGGFGGAGDRSRRNAGHQGPWCCWGGLNSRPHPYQGWEMQRIRLYSDRKNQ